MLPVWTVVELGLAWMTFGLVVGVVFGHMVLPRD
jgi:Na+/glutamate symporter